MFQQLHKINKKLRKLQINLFPMIQIKNIYMNFSNINILLINIFQCNIIKIILIYKIKIFKKYLLLYYKNMINDYIFYII